MASLKCQRCGFTAANEAKLLKHWRTETQCPALLCKTKHQDLIEQVRPKPTTEQRTCQYCHQEFKSIGGMKNHSRRCKSNLTASSSQQVNNTIEAIPADVEDAPPKKVINNVADLRKKKNLYSSVDTPCKLYAFDKEIDWTPLNFEQSYVIELCQKKMEGIIDLFIQLHNNEKHDNIRWFFDKQQEQHKLIVYDGKKWVDVNHKMLIQHLWLLYSFLEEHWCDYQSALRCDAIEQENIIPESEQKAIDEFFYDNIVDEESVYFYCKDLLNEYLEAIKTI